MSTGLRIAEVARRSGFPPTTLRYYEDIGLVTPIERTPAGYRIYDDRTVERLAFIARAKQLGCSLDEIADLLTAWDGGRCAPVQEHLRALLDTKVGEAHTQVAELLAFVAQLQGARQGLDAHTPDGPCDDECGCTRDRGGTVAVALTRAPNAETPVACTLDGAAMPARMREWRTVLAHVVERVDIPGGVRLAFGAGVEVAAVARLAAAEQECCRFFAFTLTMDGRGPALEVRAPEEASAIVTALFGSAP